MKTVTSKTVNHKEAMLSCLTVDLISKNVGEILQEIWDSPKENDADRIHISLTIGDFKKLNGFYASKKLMKEMCDVFIARFTRFYVMRYGSTSAEDVMEVFRDTEEREFEAIEIISKKFTEKYGPVTEERIKELDGIGEALQHHSLEGLKELLRTGKTDFSPKGN